MAFSPADRTWVPGADGGPHDVDHLPFGSFSTDGAPRVGVRIGDLVLDASGLDGPFGHLLAVHDLTALLAAGADVWRRVRSWLQELLTDPARRGEVEPQLIPVAEVALHLPFAVADYVDFYASEQHATNVGRIFRPDAEPLLPNWRRLPVGYHGRAGTVVVSGTPVTRPSGQWSTGGTDGSVGFGPTRQLDVEAELGFVVGVPSTPGRAVPATDLDRHVFGVLGLNDWSARDIQAWESRPLGPFLGKSFQTSVAAWVTPLAALAHARCPLPGQDPPVLPYLRVDEPAGLDIDVDVELNGTVIARPPYRSMYWGPAQLLAHLTVNGAALRTGDLLGSGTVSGAERRQRGSLLELSWGGSEPVALADGSTRTFLEDGDEVVLRYSAPGARGRLGLGEVRGRVTPTPPGWS